MPHDKIIIRGARQHNLKNIDLEIPRDRLVVITGLSGSGKSSLAFDTIYAEGQRRYVESLSAYARQFLGQMDKPDVDYIEGLSPAISIDQRGAGHNPRSTVGTVTEIYDYMRLLWARVGVPHCPQCGRVISRQSVDQIVDSILDLPEGSRIMVMAPLIRDRKGQHQRVLDEMRQGGYVRVRVDGQVRDVNEEIELDRYKNHTIEAVVDRLIIRHAEGERPDRARLADSVETALKLGKGLVVVSVVDGEEQLFSESLACAYCGISLPDIEPRTFSFNTPHGACPACTGLGAIRELDPDLIIPNPDLSIAQGAFRPWSRTDNGPNYYTQLLGAVAHHYGAPLDRPVKDLPPEVIHAFLHGSGQNLITFRYESKYGRTRVYEAPFEGIIPNLQRRYQQASDYTRETIESFMSDRPCQTCQGKRLKPSALAVTVGGRNIAEVAGMSVVAADRFFHALAESFSPREMVIAQQVLKELSTRLGFLVDVGLDYLTIDRTTGTLSGGEAQRIRLATQIGSRLMGVLYILDEPSIGLHQRDNQRLINTLVGLRDLGNTVLVVEHDEETIRAADYIVDLGPGAGEHGGEVVAIGTLQDILDAPDSLTGQYLSGKRQVPLPARRRPGNGKLISIRGASENNLKDVDAQLPLGTFICVTGVSGSGKSSLIIEVLYKRLAQLFFRSKEPAGKVQEIQGLEHLDKVIDIDQTPIGRTPRSNPATYTTIFSAIRDLFAAVPESRMRGYQPGRFSFNVKGGRCESCQGDGILKIEMQFLPDVYVPCEVCHGQRYNRETLQIHYKGKSIAEVLDMTVEEAMRFFENIPALKRKLQTLYDVGLGYIRLGQPATTLSGGEAQRIKLSKELSRRSTGRTLYLLDEPTTGLHFADIERLLTVLNRLVDQGNTVIVIEHNLDVIKTADWIIDLGPEGGEAGGRIIAEGTPEQVAAMPHSFTGQYLCRSLAAAHVKCPEPATSERLP
ncbi:MAG: excinuclease ABC subunit UvrA [Chloroflexi bacterium]|nr:excinuclease ABC subunit UvrA [Chloroflexota bacterium]